jgi:hypothetical protein
MAVFLLLGSAIVILGWYAGGASGWLALAAAGTAMRTLSAFGQVRRYKVWRAEWETMGAPLHASPRPAVAPKRRWKLVAFALLLLVVIPLLMSDGGLDDGLATALTCLWLADSLYLACKLFATIRRGLSRGPVRSAPRPQANAEAVPVAWLLDRASSSPSRADTVRNLPEYSARLLSRG